LYVRNGPLLAKDPFGLFCFSCGPEVTKWFDKEIVRFRAAAKRIQESLNDELSNSAAADGGGLGSTANYLLRFRRLAALADYKSRNDANVEPFDYSQCRDPDKNTVTLCGVCIGVNQLGNIIFGIIAVAAGAEAESRYYGLNYAVPTNWRDPGEGYRQFAFELGVDYEKASASGRPVSLCELVKSRRRLLNDATRYNTDASRKCPCKSEFAGPNTDMNRAPLTTFRGGK
jgi:hypothetical protein